MQHRGLAECLPERVGATQSPAVRGERTRDVERPVLAQLVGGHDVQRDAQATGLHLGAEVREPALLEQDRCELAGLTPFSHRPGLEPFVLIVDRSHCGQLDAERDAFGVDLCQAIALLCHPTLGDLDVVGVGVEADIVATRSHGGDRGAARAHERVEHQVAPVRVELDQAARQLDRERRRVPDSCRALGADLPQVGGRLHELVARDRGGRRQAGLGPLRRCERTIEATLAGDDDPLGDVAQDRVGRTLERAPGTRAARRAALPPHDLAPQQQAEVLEDLGDVAREGAVRPAAEVRHVHGDATTRLEHPLALGEHVVEQLEVLEVVGRHAVDAELLFVGLAGEVRRRRDDQRDRVRRDLGHVACVVGVDDVEVRRRRDGRVGRDLWCHEAVVERGGVMALSSAGTEVGRRRRGAGAAGGRRGTARGAHASPPASGASSTGGRVASRMTAALGRRSRYSPTARVTSRLTDTSRSVAASCRRWWSDSGRRTAVAMRGSSQTRGRPMARTVPGQTDTHADRRAQQRALCRLSSPRPSVAGSSFLLTNLQVAGGAADLSGDGRRPSGPERGERRGALRRGQPDHRGQCGDR